MLLMKNCMCQSHPDWSVHIFSSCLPIRIRQLNIVSALCVRSKCDLFHIKITSKIPMLFYLTSSIPPTVHLHTPTLTVPLTVTSTLPFCTLLHLNCVHNHYLYCICICICMLALYCIVLYCILLHFFFFLLFL
ncbi:hypothetical protein AAFF_G00019230 [Aldrovandia affinis]|uniref:Uncharacterized protein n=1 Tax=Aldrovandia affinis TaxID=143900 RepID=A0AAD7S5J4_9TELE|nr:hypothetical protein AAFF_G00019230 [Aldrovandia affinis]